MFVCDHAGLADQGWGLSIDSRGRILITGAVQKSGPNADMFIIRLR